MKSVLSVALVSLGINQTLVIAAIPTLMTWVGQTDPNYSLGWLVFTVNLNLVSYWLGATYWGGVAAKLGFTRAIHLAALGYIGANVLFIATLLGESTHLWLIGLCRLLVGGFSSAFLPLTQTRLAAQADATPAALSSLSSSLTLGRLLGPGLLFLPLSLPYLMLVPVLLVIPVLFGRYHVSPKVIFPPQPKAIKLVTTWQRFAYISAMFTTAIVAVFQFNVLQFLTIQGYQGEQGSDVYAALMLATSILLVVYQIGVIPSLNRRRAHLFLPILLTALVSGGVILVLFGDMWWGLGSSLVGLLLAIAGLPAWYTSGLLTSVTGPIEQAKYSGYLTRAHTTGHIIGTGAAALFLHQQWMLSLLIAFISACLFYSALKLKSSTDFNTTQSIKSH
ncbi:hypothetical protein HQQ94_19335 [Shewanella sp. VB17]|uniref:hypothetical protein n=1 Tax=Shewanella sp. VB17 TaxID=2739432 RepID=UPI0015670DB1|nr:hypothetical protein [Shewanella sp. VB17]NRD75338.1 hypothetical protein [Shewanella sp. VB17]